MIIANGKNNLSNVYVSMLFHTQLGATDPQASIRQLNSWTSTLVPMILAGHSVDLPIRIKPEGNLDMFQIDMMAANGTVMEMLTLKKVANEWIQNIYVADPQGHVLLKVPKKTTKKTK